MGRAACTLGAGGGAARCQLGVPRGRTASAWLVPSRIRRLALCVADPSALATIVSRVALSYGCAGLLGMVIVVWIKCWPARRAGTGTRATRAYDSHARWSGAHTAALARHSDVCAQTTDSAVSV